MFDAAGMLKSPELFRWFAMHCDLVAFVDQGWALVMKNRNGPAPVVIGREHLVSLVSGESLPPASYVQLPRLLDYELRVDSGSAPQQLSKLREFLSRQSAQLAARKLGHPAPVGSSSPEHAEGRPRLPHPGEVGTPPPTLCEAYQGGCSLADPAPSIGCGNPVKAGGLQEPALAPHLSLYADLESLTPEQRQKLGVFLVHKLWAASIDREGCAEALILRRALSEFRHLSRTACLTAPAEPTSAEVREPLSSGQPVRDVEQTNRTKHITTIETTDAVGTDSSPVV